MNYQFTRSQLNKALGTAVEMYREYVDRHGYDEIRAMNQAVADTLEGMDAEAELIEFGDLTASDATFTAVAE